MSTEQPTSSPTVEVELPAELVDQIEREAALRGMSVPDFVHEFLSEYFARHPEPAGESEQAQS